MYLAHYTEYGTITGFYLLGLHVNIPAPTIKVTEEQHQDYFNRSQSFKVIDGEFTYIGFFISLSQFATTFIFISVILSRSLPPTTKSKKGEDLCGL